MSKMQVDISTRLDKLLSIQLMHDYYGDGQARGLMLQPTADTTQVLGNFWLRFKELNIDGFTGGILMYDPQRTPSLLERPDWRPQKLSFLLLNNNPKFHIITKSPFYGAYQGFYVNNGGKERHASGRVMLHAGENLAEEALAPVHFVGPRMTYQGREERVDPNLLKGFDADGNPVDLGIHELTLNSGLLRQVPLNLSGLPEGYYELQMGDDATDRMPIYLLKGTISRQVLGVIDLYMSPTESGSLTLLNEDASDPEELVRGLGFAIRFASRETKWRYILVNPRGQQYSGFTIANTGEGGALTFGEPEAITLRDKPMAQGTEATRLVAQSSIAMQEFPPQRLELTAKKKLNGKQDVLKLPLPGIERIKADPDTPETYYSDVYVYL